jgi:hypothetical protein
LPEWRVMSDIVKRRSIRALRVTKVTGGALSPFGIRKTGIRDQEILIPDIRLPDTRKRRQRLTAMPLGRSYEASWSFKSVSPSGITRRESGIREIPDHLKPDC